MIIHIASYMNHGGNLHPGTTVDIIASEMTMNKSVFFSFFFFFFRKIFQIKS
jgi:hypothetical protein